MNSILQGERAWLGELDNAVVERLSQCKEELAFFAVEQKLEGHAPVTDLPFDDYLRLDEAYLAILQPHQIERSLQIAAEASNSY